MVQEKLVSSEKTKNDNNVYHEEKFNSPLLKFNNSEEWKSNIKIGDLTEKVIAGATPRTSNNEYWENGTIPWLSSGEIHKKHIEYTDKFITKLGYDNSSTKMIPKHSVLIALAGQGKTRGTVAINNIELCTNQSVASIIPNDTKLYYKYLFYYLENQYDKLRALSSSDGGRGGLNLKLIKSFKINLPSIDEQKKIANFISKIDEKIELLEKKLVLYQKFNESMKEELFTNFEPYTKLRLNKFLKESKIKSKDNINRRLTVKLNLKGITKREVKSVEKEGATTQYLRKEGQFIYGKQNLHKGAFGIIPKELDNYLSSSDIPSFDFIEDTVNPMWFYFYFSRKSFYIKLERFSIGTGSKRISPDEFLNIQISIPELNIQNKQAEFLNNLNKKENVLKNEISSMKIYKKYLLQKMFV